jgi:hypothetical protein
MSESNQEPPEKPGKPGPFQIALSVIAAAFGVQSDANRERDFAHGNPLAFIIGGLIFTVVFVLTLIGIVMLVLP